MNRDAALGAALVAECALLAMASAFGDFTKPGYARIFVALMLGAGACFIFASVRAGNKASATGPLAAVSNRRRDAGSLLLFWIAVIALRFAMLTTAPGDDFWRYLWEGRVQIHGFNPYVQSPVAPELMPLRDAHWSRINHPESAAIYPPGTELLFWGLSYFSHPHLLLKCVFVCADLCTIWLLLGLTGSLSATAWYAWNPAVIYAFAGAGHFDSLMLCSMTGAIFALDRGSSRRSPGWKWPLSSATLLGVAIAFKLIPIFLLPACICALRARALVFAISLAVPVALSSFYGGLAVVCGPLLRFADVTRFNDLVWWILEALTIPNPFQRNWPFTVALSLAVLVAAWRHCGDWRRGAFWSLGFALVLSPVLHPWYVTWILPLAVWRRVPAWSVLSLSALTAFLLWEKTPWWNPWEPNLITRILVIAPALLAWRFQVSSSLLQQKVS